jgi:hypothetical protein
MLLNRKVILLAAFLCVFLCILTLQDTYAKYTSAVNETTDISIARWRILVNDFDIRSNSTTENLITPVFSGNSNIASGVIAPTAEGYFDVVIDATGTDLSFAYTISVSNSDDSPVSDIKVTNCTLNGTTIPFVDDVITGNISLTDQRVNTIRVYIEWFDGTGENMDNAEDTSTTMLDDSVAKINVNANFTQISS